MPINLGYGHTATFFSWSPDRELNPQYKDLPDIERAGAIIDHPRPDNGEPCSGGVNFEPPPAHRAVWGERTYWQVQSLEPLTISPSVLCKTCGDHGYIRSGRWVPA